MPKQKTKKTILKRIKITSKGKILRRHQLGAGHLKRHKSKGALESQKKTMEYFKGESKRFKNIIGD
ncbi:hypothetical protein A3C26_04475 [Candidatus Daviesbacteria bacterium RIFCSPHIGHO2_02_FULL_39_12]|uniref:50S ribosomal protein L35 n=1 Tax=Candidatus Daviesbacteria bacterium RIFCSPHIGHO2_02_FULL_39_12 TaxID=1797770 RepID=A0A1F5J984_9BACT|nr:MAG: hypothetical protein A3C26_04475 [Candidatus Daviesbacteria bacterium RIFCSPHIGHO2_02_FULL_39_12]